MGWVYAGRFASTGEVPSDATALYRFADDSAADWRLMHGGSTNGLSPLPTLTDGVLRLTRGANSIQLTTIHLPEGRRIDGEQYRYLVMRLRTSHGRPSQTSPVYFGTLAATASEATRVNMRITGGTDWQTVVLDMGVNPRWAVSPVRHLRVDSFGCDSPGEWVEIDYIAVTRYGPGISQYDYAQTAARSADTQRRTTLRPDNLVLRSSFEDGEPGGWSGGATVVDVDDHPYRTKVAQVSGSSYVPLGEMFDCTPGEVFTLRIDAKSSDATVNITPTIQWFNKAGVVVGYASSPPTESVGTTDWTVGYTLTGKTAPAGAARGRPGLSFHGSGGTVQFTDFIVKRGLNTAGGNVGAHTHAIVDVAGLQAALDSKAADDHQHNGYARLYGGNTFSGVQMFNGDINTGWLTTTGRVRLHTSNMYGIRIGTTINETRPLVNTQKRASVVGYSYAAGESTIPFVGVLQLDSLSTGTFLRIGGPAGDSTIRAPDSVTLVTTKPGETRGTAQWQVDSIGAFLPVANNANDIGATSQRVRNIYAANPLITTSDARLKTAPRVHTAAEDAAALEIMQLPMLWQWLHEADTQGAPYHAGPTVQAVIEIMQAHGLDWSAYSFVRHDTWGAVDEVIETIPAQYDDDGAEIAPEQTVVVQAAQPAGDVYSLCKEELLWFVLPAVTRAMMQQTSASKTQRKR